jgi:hypothetical protein
VENYFSQLLNARKVSGVRLIKTHRAEPLVRDPRPFEFEIAIAELKYIYFQVVIKFKQKLIKQEVKHSV